MQQKQNCFFRVYKFCTLLLFAVGLCFQLKSQNIDHLYSTYLKQYEALASTRELGPLEISKNISDFKQINLKSVDDLAGRIKLYYPKQQDLGILLFFYQRDTLFRLFFEPGICLEKKAIYLNKGEFKDLTESFYSSLNIYDKVAGRSPYIRGSAINLNNNKSALSYKEFIDTFTDILLPECLTDKYKHLIVIPALNIGTFPFHLLKPYNDELELIDNCSFSIAPTLLDFVFANEIKRRTSENLNLSNTSRWQTQQALFICNPDYPKTGSYVFPDLPGAEKEVNAAIPFTGKSTRLLKGKNAQKDSFFRYLNGSDLLYVATHGMSDSANPLQNNFLVLSGEDPFLTSLEIMNLRLLDSFTAPELVILSACQTGLGKSMEAGTAASMARAFIISGTKYVVQSLWSVDDEATAHLMNRFMFWIHEGTPFFPAEALRLAVLDTRKVFPNPIYWASFSLIGTLN